MIRSDLLQNETSGSKWTALVIYGNQAKQQKQRRPNCASFCEFDSMVRVDRGESLSGESWPNAVLYALQNFNKKGCR